MTDADATAAPRRVLVIGGYGGFGARLSRRLAAQGHLVIVAGRSAERARAFAATFAGAEGVALDTHTPDLANRIAATGAALVIDAAGPFQQAQPWVARAALAAGIDYCDLADARDFVCGIAALDAEAKAKGIAILSGASSVPALSGAVVRHLADGMARIASVDIAISASNRGGAGASVARAMLSYAGKSFGVWRGGRANTLVGWQGLTSTRIAIDHSQSLGRRWLADADVPDLALLPERLPGRPSVRFRAGTDRAVQVTGLWLIAAIVRSRLIGSGIVLAGLLRPLQQLTGVGASLWSGMQVRIIGERDGVAVEREWTLLVGDGKGPEVPTIAAALLADRMLRGVIAPGARDAGEALEIGDFDAAFDSIAALRETRERILPPSLYRQVLGDAFELLPKALQSMHSIIGVGGAGGRGTVTRGRDPVARLIAAMMRFPRGGDHDLHVLFEIGDEHEIWTRDFGGQRFHSCLSKAGGQLTESFGPMRFHFDLPVDAGGLTMLLNRWTMLGVPMPLCLAPRITARETEEQGHFTFDVAIAFPVVGNVIRYCGWLDRIA